MPYLNRTSARFHRSHDYHFPNRRPRPAVGERIELLGPDTRQSRRRERPLRTTPDLAA